MWRNNSPFWAKQNNGMTVKWCKIYFQPSFILHLGWFNVAFSIKPNDIKIWGKVMNCSIDVPTSRWERSNHMKLVEPIFSLALENHTQGYTFTCHKQEPQQRIFWMASMKGSVKSFC